VKELFSLLPGNQHLKRSMAADIERGTLLHAYIIEAPRGSGKYTFALSLAAALACKNKNALAMPCGDCENCRKILYGGCVDVITVDTNGTASIKIEQIRKLKENTVLSPSELEIKAYIIKDADKMTEEAQNALLKTIEEPPVQATYYFLLAENAEMLLPTIRSRAPVTRLTPPTRAEVTDTVIKQGKHTDRAAVLRAAAAAGNSLYFTNGILEGSEEGKEKLSLYETAEKALSLLCSRGSRSEFIMYFTSVSAKKDTASAIFRLIYSALRDIIAVKRNARADTDFYTDAATAQSAARGMTLRGAMKTSDAVCEAIASLDKNAIPKNVLLAFAINAHNAINGERKG